MCEGEKVGEVCVCIAIFYVTLQFVFVWKLCSFSLFESEKTRVNDGVRGRDREEDGHKSYLVGNIAPLWQLCVTAPRLWENGQRN